ncbi:DEAD/DEAH box helicase [Corynebacterium aquilae]|uniref:ATP-dependent RNA helicase DeaD n=1 Tax=Corynebacterium aquilae DSM 44791 TaxID=1431546 RepID=A0A1L7CFG6_9CORY|nr:DEAD/DEAH box helicase [Corynebacterium aquilae]APT84523.1 DEAD/DEAH box helicase [Corynebacterium aquilae DSM 44791]
MSNTDNVTGDVNEPENVILSEVEDHSQGEQQAAGEAKESEATGPNEGFDGLGLPANVLSAVAQVGYETPSPIQSATIPVLMEGHDVVGLAQTGTGKTAAFALPVLARIDSQLRAPQALVLAPTRELALQVADAFQSFADNLGGIHVLPIYGGQAYGVQLSGLRRGAQIIVGTPGRVIDHLSKGSLDLSQLKFLVLDEADEMLNMGFQEDVERILADTPDTKQVALFSATMPPAIRRLSKQYLNEPREITVKSETRTNTNITQRYLSVAHRNKLDALTRILEVTEFEAMIMFVRTKHETEELAEKLRARGFSAAAINGDIAQAQRERTVDQLKDGRLDILVATDVAARGLDVDRISHVLNYDIPNDTESYVHRIGRTGRAGRSGEAILFVTPRERRMLRSIERATNAPLEEMELPTVDEVNEFRKSKFMDSITESLEHTEVAMFRGLVKKYSDEHDVPLEDIAAALATQVQADDFLLKELPQQRRERDRDRDRGDRGERRERFDRDAPSRFDRDGKEMAVYRIAVGKRQHVRPGAIVGALANEGGLSNRDFGRITILMEHSLVELPKDLPREVFDALSDTRISGELINIEPDPGPPAGRPAYNRERGGDRGGYRGGRDREDRGGYRGGRDDRGGFRGGRGGRDRDDRGGFRGGRDDRGGFRGGRGGRDRDDRGGDRGGFRGGRDRY